MPITAVKNGLTSLRRMWSLDINASDNDLEKSIEENDGRENVCARALILGLLIEVVFAFWFRDGKTFIRNWSPVFADVLVAGGVLGEVHFASKISQAGGELRRRSTERLAEAVKIAGEANERAANAEKAAAEARERTAEIEKLTAWRRLSVQQKSAITNALLATGEQIVSVVEHQTGDPEAHMLARDIGMAINAANEKAFRFVSTLHLSVTMFGAHVMLSDKVRSDDVVSAFSSAGVTVLPAEHNPSFKKNVGEWEPNIYLWVGPKIPAEADDVKASVVIPTTNGNN